MLVDDILECDTMFAQLNIIVMKLKIEGMYVHKIIQNETSIVENHIDEVVKHYKRLSLLCEIIFVLSHMGQKGMIIVYLLKANFTVMFDIAVLQKNDDISVK
jgi:hypothetical protein